MDREQKGSASHPTAWEKTTPGANQLGRLGPEAAANADKLLPSILQADKRWQAAMGRLADLQDQLRSIRCQHDHCVDELRTLRTQELEQIKGAQLSAAQRIQQTQLYLATAGAALGFLGYANSKGLASAALRFLELGNVVELHRLENRVRLLSTLLCLAPASAFILGSKASKELKVTVTVLFAGVCFLETNYLEWEVLSKHAGACGVAGALTTPLLLLTLYRNRVLKPRAPRF